MLRYNLHQDFTSGVEIGTFGGVLEPGFFEMIEDVMTPSGSFKGMLL